MQVRVISLAIVMLAAPAATLAAQQPGQAPAGVVNASALEEPPQPMPGTCRPPSYPALLRASQIEGRVILEFVVDTAGRIEASSVNTITSSHSQFEEAARRALLTCRYRPARFNDQPARVLVRLPYNFTISRS